MTDEQLDRLRKFFDEENKRIEAMAQAAAFDLPRCPHTPWTLAQITDYRSLLPQEDKEAAWAAAENPEGIEITASAIELVDREIGFHIHCTQRKDG